MQIVNLQSFKSVACGDVTYATKDGKFHREDGPAAILKDGTEFWYYNNKIHRKDGPAIIKKDSHQITKIHWYYNDKAYSFKNYCKVAKLPEELQLTLAFEYAAYIK